MTALDLAKAAEKCVWALGTSGAQQVLRVLPARSAFGNKIRTRIYKTTKAAQEEFEQIAPLFFAYEVGHQFEHTIANLTADAATLTALNPAYLIGAGLSLADFAEDAVKSVGSSESRPLYLQQLRNNFAVVDFVNQSDAPARLAADGTYPLDEKVANCYEGNYPERDWPALWKVEGAGEKFAEAHLHVNRNPHGLLTSGLGFDQPDKAWLMLHSGMGIAFAKDVIKTITPWSSDLEFDRALRRFIELCRANSQPGYSGAALQSLGLVTRTWHRSMVEPISSHLQTIDPSVREMFWRAVGGALYFSPLNWIPGWSPWFSAEGEPPDRITKKNARAGVAWPFTIVNMRQPGIMANFLKHKLTLIRDKDAWRNGVLSALIMASESVPDHHYVAEFAAYQPADKPARDAWDEYIGTDLKARVDNCRETLKRHHQLDAIFRYQNLVELATSLEAAEKENVPAGPVEKCVKPVQSRA